MLCHYWWNIYADCLLPMDTWRGVSVSDASERCRDMAWWRHQMETFSALLAICAGNSPVPGEFPTQRPVTRSFDVYFDQRPNKRLSKQSWGWWFTTQSCPLWRHRNGFDVLVALVLRHVSIGLTLYFVLFAVVICCITLSTYLAFILNVLLCIAMDLPLCHTLVYAHLCGTLCGLWIKLMFQKHGVFGHLWAGGTYIWGVCVQLVQL